MKLDHIKTLEAFREIIQLGSVTSAARALGLSQPAVSRLLAQFETGLGFKLFHRSKGRLLPTSQALLLYEEVDLALQGIELWRTGGLSLPMERHDREDVLAIKTGSVDFADAMSMIDSAADRLRRVTDESTPLRAEPDYAAVDRLLHSIHMAVWPRMGGGA